MAINKLIVDSEVKFDLTGDTVAPDKMVSGTTAHDKSGKQIEGTIPEVARGIPEMTANYVQQNNIFYMIQAKVKQEAGVVDAGTKVAAHYIPVQRGRTITPSTKNIAAFPQGYYSAGAVTVLGDVNLVPENIRNGVSIFGVNGSFCGDTPYVPRFLWAYEDRILTYDPSIVDNGPIPDDLTDSILLFFPLHWGSMQWDFSSGNRFVMYAIHFDGQWFIGSTHADNMGLEYFEPVSDGSTIAINTEFTDFILNGLYLLMSPAYAI